MAATHRDLMAEVGDSYFYFYFCTTSIVQGPGSTFTAKAKAELLYHYVSLSSLAGSLHGIDNQHGCHVTA